MPRYQRQSSIINIENYRDNKITIVGCGAIGSFVAISLAKMGLTKFEIWDHDKVEEHNLPNQFFFDGDIGMNKTTATRRNMNMFNNECKIEIGGQFQKGVHSFKNTNILISCVDTMGIRRALFEQAKKDKKVQLFIDTRMAGLQGQIYVVDMTKKKEKDNYEKGLFDDSEAVQMRCTERSVIFTVLGIASFVCNQIVKALKGEEVKNYIVLDYSVPQMI